MIYVWVESKADRMLKFSVWYFVQPEDGLFIELPLIAAYTD
jgi:hypothetical protein